MIIYMIVSDELPPGREILFFDVEAERRGNREGKFNPLRANYCHTWHMENHPFLWRRIRCVRRIQVCMARKGLKRTVNRRNTVDTCKGILLPCIV